MATARRLRLDWTTAAPTSATTGRVAPWRRGRGWAPRDGWSRWPTGGTCAPGPRHRIGQTSGERLQRFSLAGAAAPRHRRPNAGRCRRPVTAQRIACLSVGRSFIDSVGPVHCVPLTSCRSTWILENLDEEFRGTSSEVGFLYRLSWFTSFYSEDSWRWLHWKAMKRFPMDTRTLILSWRSFTMKYSALLKIEWPNSKYRVILSDG